MTLRLEARSEAADAAAFGKAFSDLPEQVRIGNSRIGLPPAAAWQRFLSLAPAGGAEFWVAWDEDRAVGRLGANLLPSRPDTGAVGFFEVEDGRADVARLLLDAGAQWLRARGKALMVGPMCLNTWFPYRFRTDGHELSFRWEPSNPPSYPGLFVRYGFEPVESYFSTASASLASYAEKTAPSLQRAKDAGYTFRGFDAERVLEREVPILYELSMEGFKDNYLFEPVPFELFRELYVPLAKTMDFSYSNFAVDPSGKEVGFFFCLQESDSVVLKSVAVTPAARGVGLSNALSHLAAKRGLETGLTGYITALVRSGAQSESYTKKSTTLWTHRYELYRKAL